jgi:hypothetical protein
MQTTAWHSTIVNFGHCRKLLQKERRMTYEGPVCKTYSEDKTFLEETVTLEVLSNRNQRG